MPRTTPPKPPGARRRRNLGQTQWRTFAATPRSGRVPPLPARKPGWSPSTRAFWRRVWRAPMAAAYLEADLSALYRLAELVEQQSRGTLPSGALGAMQRLEDAFGLSPRARQMLQWQVLAAGEPLAAGAPSSTSGSAPAASVRRLRAVDPKAASS